MTDRDVTKRATWVWRALEDAFGAARWRACRGAEPNRAWLAGLSSLSDEEIRDGVRRTLSEWDSTRGPPDWLEFRDLARPPDKRSPEQRAFNARLEREQPARLRGPEPTGPRRIADTVDAIDTTQTGRAWLDVAQGRVQDESMAEAVERERKRILERYARRAES